MKKKVILLMVILMAIVTNAQEIAKNALGLRVGGLNGFGAELSYQRGLSGNNRAEFNLGVSNYDNEDSFRIVGLYQWVYDFDNNFNWYIGAGGGYSNSNRNVTNSNQKSNKDYLLVAGTIGVEYLFDFPLQVSLDLRPELGLSANSRYFGTGLGLGLRYRF